MVEAWRLGNDVVDLTAPRTRDKSSDIRFLRRVFDPEEAEALVSSPLPDRSLWLYWAAKEAIFKSVSKELGDPPVFNHPTFRVRFDARELLRLAEDPHPGGELPPLRGSGTHGDRAFGLLARWTREYIHTLAWLGGPARGMPDVLWKVVALPAADPAGPRGAGKEDLESRFTAEEWECVSHRRSAASRLEARRALAESLGVEEGRLEIRCAPGPPGRRAPLTFLDGRRAFLDLTLSHDGPFLGRAFLRQPYRAQGR